MNLSPHQVAAIIGFAMVMLFAIGGHRTQQHSIAASSSSVVGPLPTSPGAIGVYLDHRGDGAIEFRPCGGKLCGHVVWVRDGAPAEACGTEIIGDAAPVRDGVWDGGWILDPDIGQKFDVEITQLGEEKLQVMGYIGSKDLSETFLWKKAPAGLERCQLSSDVALAPGR